MTKEEIKAAIVACAERLGHVPSHSEIAREALLGRRQIRRHFGTYTRALRECNMERRGGGHRYPLGKLFQDWAMVVRTLKKVPSIAEYELVSSHTQGPLTRRFGSWLNVPQGMKEFAEKEGWAVDWKDVLEIVGEANGAKDGTARSIRPAYASLMGPRVQSKGPVYGPLMRSPAMAYGPVNEAGVVYLFGTLAERLGFMMLRMQSDFPDGEAMRRIEEERWERVRIEFEYESRNFLKHMHDAHECDLIVCWRHNWPECPLEVLELRSIQQ
jgi:HNH endonuclease